MSDSSKVSLERAINMTLDEYIAESGIPYIRTPKRSPVNNVNMTAENVEDINIADDFCSNINEVANIRYPNNNSQVWDVTDSNNTSEKLMSESVGITRRNGKKIYRGKSRRNNKRRKPKVQQKKNGNVFWNKYRGNTDSDNLFTRRSNTSRTSSTCRSTLDLTIHAANSPEIPNSKTSTMEVQPCQLSFPGQLNMSNLLLSLVPLIVEKVLERIHMPSTAYETSKYDMNVQKIIHDIQQKTFAYKCPGGTVISSDGPGINIRFTPVATDMTFNQRFA